MPISEKSTLMENNNFSLLKTIFTLFSIIAIRLFLDNLAYPSTEKYFYTIERFIQAPLYFFSVFLSLTIIMYFFTKKPFEEISNFLIKVFLFVLTVPLIDLILTGTVPDALKYITVNSNEIVPTFFSIMNPLSGQGITVGQHLAAYAIFISIASFIYKKTKNYYKGLISVLFGYGVLFFYAILPSLVVMLNFGNKSELQSAPNIYNLLLNQSWISYSMEKSNLLDKLFFHTSIIHEIAVSQIFFVILMLQIVVLFFIYGRSIWVAIKNDLRITRIAYWFIVAAIGIIMNHKLFGDINLNNPVNIVSLTVFLLLIFLNIWLAVFINDTEDIAIDRISNPDRPLVAKTISIGNWNDMQIVVLLLIAFGTATMNRSAALLLVMAQASYYLYSARPLRLKKHFISSSLLTGLAAVFISMAGFFLVSPDQHIFTFPIKAIFVIGISYALLSNIKDIKDFSGDSFEDIKTIPVVFGITKSKYIIATLYSLVIISVPLLLKAYAMMLPAICVSIFIFYLFIKKEYQEKYIFMAFFLYAVTFFFVLK